MKDRNLLADSVDAWAQKRKDPNRRNGSWVHDPKKCILCLLDPEQRPSEQFIRENSKR